MNRPIRLPGIIITLITALSFFAVSADAAGIDGIYASEMYVEQGKSFYVSITIPASAQPADSVAIQADFDPNVFEAIDWDAGLNISKDLQFSSINNTEGHIVFTTANTEESIDLSKGLVFTARMKAKDNAVTGRHYITLSRHSATSSVIIGNEKIGISLWDPASTYVAVEVGTSTAAGPYPVNGGGIELSGYALYRGNSFNVMLEIPPSRKAENASLLVNFDSSAFELLQWAPNVAGAAAYSGNGYFSLTANNPSAMIDLTNGMTLYASFRVRNNAPSGSYNFKLERSSFTFYDSGTGTYTELWKPVNTVIAATIYEGNNGENNGNSSSFSPGQIVVVPENENTQPAPDTNPSAPDQSYYDDEIDYSETDEEEDYIEPQSSENEETIDNSETEIDITDNEAEIDITDNETEIDITDGGNSETETDITDIGSGEDPDDPDTADNGEKNTEPSVTVSLDASGLSRLTAKSVILTTKNSYFSGNSTVILSNTDYSVTAAQEALRQLGMSGHICYAFDISVLNTDNNRYIHELANGGFISLQVPIPQEMADAPENVEVFHIEDGRPVVIDREIVTEGGTVFLSFSADSFSPYMFADTARTYPVQQSNDPGIVSDDVGMITTGNTPQSGGGPVNPNTGVAAAVVIPAAVTACVLLARKTVRKRHRAGSRIDDDESDIPDFPVPPEIK